MAASRFFSDSGPAPAESSAPDSMLPPLTTSTFSMLRCVVAVACADLVVKRQEIVFLRVLLSHFKRHFHVTKVQIEQLKLDLKHAQPIDALLAQTTDRHDREQLIIFSGMLAQADGEVHPWEEAVLDKIKAHRAPPLAPGENAPPEAPSINMEAFMQEVRDVVGQDAYKQTMAKSGVSRGTDRAAVADAFAAAGNVTPPSEAYAVLAGQPRVSASMSHYIGPMEKVLDTGRIHWINTAQGLAVALVLTGLAKPVAGLIGAAMKSAGDYLLSEQNTMFDSGNTESIYKVISSPMWETTPMALLYMAAGAFILWRALVQWTTEIVVTDSRLIAKQGIKKIRHFNADISTLDKVEVKQSLFGDLLNFGVITVRTDGWKGQGSQLDAEGIHLPPLADPHAFSALVDRARRMWRARGS